MVIFNKQVIGAYAGIMLDIIENNPSKENTEKIYDTLDWLGGEWTTLYYFSNNITKEEYKEVSDIIKNLMSVVSENEIVDFDNDEMFKGLMQLIGIGKED